MLPKDKRLTRKEINELKARKLPVIQGQFLGLIFYPDNASKFGVIISTKIDKRAVVRNQIKRQVFWVAKKTHFKKSGKFLFLAKKAIGEAKQQDLIRELENFNNKI